MLRSMLVSGLIIAGSLVAVPAAMAAANHAGSGQPSASCEESTVAPPGFGTGGFENAESHYAGSEGTHSLNSGNDHAVSQYDVACFQLTSHSH